LVLMTQDRAHSDSFHLTHEFLAYMLGVRRVGITGAASDLQRRGLIGYHRGEVTVLDRAGLEGTACGCYAADQAYDRMLGWSHSRRNPREAGLRCDRSDRIGAVCDRAESATSASLASVRCAPNCYERARL
jgi:Crp-like helix-turn-helix domain